MADDTSDNHHDDENLTTSTRERWEYIGTVLSALMVSSLPVLLVGTAFGIFTLSGIGQAWYILYATVVTMAATWAFGKETLEVVRQARGK